MGVISTIKRHIHDYVDQTLDEMIELDINEDQVEKKKSNKKKPKRSTKPESLKPFNYRPKSSRKKRRFENADELYMFADPEDLDEVNIGHFMSPNMSAFAKLFMERENMKLWNDFISGSEDDQRKLLYGSDCIESALVEDSSTSEESDPYNMKAHPAYSPQDCFQHIDRELRQILRKHAPLGLITDLEDSIRSFFSEYPKAKYDCQLADSYSRLMLHAISQYHHLHCHSYNSDGLRRTTVKNNYETFDDFSVPMAAFLENPINNRL